MNIDTTTENGETAEYEGGKREYTWSVNLELDRHAEDRDAMVEEALEAVGQTASGYFVNLVTHEEHGHPSGYLYDALDDEFDVEYEFVDQCGCGGYVTRVHVG